MATPVGIGFFTPFPNPTMLPFMAMQSLIQGMGMGIGSQYGKRKIASLTNEEFNKLTPHQLQINLTNDLLGSLPILEKSMNDMTPLMNKIIEEMGDMVKEGVNALPEAVASIGGGSLESGTPSVFQPSAPNADGMNMIVKSISDFFTSFAVLPTLFAEQMPLSYGNQNMSRSSPSGELLDPDGNVAVNPYTSDLRNLEQKPYERLEPEPEPIVLVDIEKEYADWLNFELIPFQKKVLDAKEYMLTDIKDLEKQKADWEAKWKKADKAVSTLGNTIQSAAKLSVGIYDQYDKEVRNKTIAQDNINSLEKKIKNFDFKKAEADYISIKNDYYNFLRLARNNRTNHLIFNKATTEYDAETL